jgi:hypothetical protein
MEARSQLRHRPTRRVSSFSLTEAFSSNSFGFLEFRGNFLFAAGIVSLVMRVLLPCCFAFVALSFVSSPTLSFAQSEPASASASAAPSGSTTSGSVQPSLDQIQQTLSNLNLSKWKTRDDIREAMFQNISSIQRDIQGTLPGLLSQADAAPNSIEPTFALYRNLDALYDVLLRISSTASMVASSNDSASLSSSLQSLESVRKSLGERILNVSQLQEQTIVKLQASARAVPAAAPAAASQGAVVDDGPQAPPKKKKKPAAKPKPAPAPATTPTPPTN